METPNRSAPNPPDSGLGRDGLFSHAEALGFGELHFTINRETQLKAVIAIHSTTLGPALGGCRCLPYASEQAAIDDALRLARAMSYKAAISGLDSGGGKAVLIRPSRIRDRQAYFESFGEFIETLGGRFITSVDSGTGPADMDCIAHKSRHVTSTSGGSGDPSPYTALGVIQGILAAVAHRFGCDHPRGLRAVVQGVGSVGRDVARQLLELGVEVYISDIDHEAVERCVAALGVRALPPDEVYSIPCDLFVPCALGGVINPAALDRLQTAIIAGAANNQLSEPGMDRRLLQRGILYAPDYVINAGGLMQVILQEHRRTLTQIETIRPTLERIFRESANRNRPTGQIADRIAEERLYPDRGLGHSHRNPTGRNR